MATNIKRGLAAVVARAADRYSVAGAAVGVLAGRKEHHVTHGVTNVEFPLDVDENTIFMIGSTTKTFTGTALMTLVEEGKVDLEAPVTAYLPTFKLKDKAALRDLRVRHLVSHTGGFTGDYFDDLGRGADAVAKIVSRIRAKAPQLTPVGQLWSYNNAGFYALGRIIEQVSGRSYEDFVNERVIAPLGMDHTFWFAEDVVTRKTASGHTLRLDGSPAVARPWGLVRSANPAGGIASTSVDMLRYARLHLEGGRAADGTRVLKAATVRRMQRPLTKIGWGIADDMGVTWLLDRIGGTKVVKHGGTVNAQMSEFLFVPSKGVALSVLTNSQRGHELGTAVIKWVLSEVAGVKAVERPVSPVSARVADQYTGRYPAGMGTYVVTTENGGLLLTMELPKEILEANPEIAAQIPPPLPLGFVGRDRAVVQGDYIAGSRVEFFRDADGVVEWMRFGGRITRRQPS